MKGYQLLPSKEYESNNDLLFTSTSRAHRLKPYDLVWSLILVLSNVATFVFTTWLLKREMWSVIDRTFTVSDAVQHSREIPTVIDHQSLFYDETNLDSVYQAWESINVDAGMITLTEEESRALNVPLGSPFYWNPSESVYLLEGYHSLHCTKVLFTAITQYRSDTPQSNKFSHVLHCLDTLRQKVLCDADDTPRWVEYYSPTPSSGLNQTRMCRSWDKLETWANQHSACYKMQDREGVPDHLKTLSRYSYCPPDSPYRQHIEEVFGNVFDVDLAQDTANMK